MKLLAYLVQQWPIGFRNGHFAGADSTISFITTQKKGPNNGVESIRVFYKNNG